MNSKFLDEQDWHRLQTRNLEVYPDFFTMKNSFNRVSFGFCNFCQNLFGLQFRVLFRDNNNVKDELM